MGRSLGLADPRGASMVQIGEVRVCRDWVEVFPSANINCFENSLRPLHMLKALF